MQSIASTTVVAISGQTGSGGHDIAELVSDQLNLPLFDREIINRAAAAAGVEPDVIGAAETVPSLITRIVEQLGRYPFGVDPEGIANAPASPDLLLTSTDYRDLIDSVVQQVATQQSAVIYGHGAAQTLRAQANVVRVLILAPAEVRARRYAADEGGSFEDAQQAVRAGDRQRAEFFRHYYSLDWLEAKRYDLVLNTAHISDQLAADLIVQITHERIGREAPDPPVAHADVGTSKG